MSTDSSDPNDPENEPSPDENAGTQLVDLPIEELLRAVELAKASALDIENANAMHLATVDDEGRPVQGEKGELVCLKAFPSMPIFFWGDDDGSSYQRAYFDRFPGVWCHGDFIEVNETTAVQVHDWGFFVLRHERLADDVVGALIGRSEVGESDSA